MLNVSNLMLQPKLLFVSDVASTLRCSCYKVYNLLHNGRLKGYRTAEKGTWLIPIENVESFINESMAQYEVATSKGNDQRTSE